MTPEQEQAIRRKKAAAEMRRAVAEGKCRRCRCPNPDAGLWNECRPCRAKTNEHARRKRLARLACGTCCQCDRPPLPGKTRCEYHHDIQRKATRKHFETFRAKKGGYGPRPEKPSPAPGENTPTPTRKRR